MRCLMKGVIKVLYGEHKIQIFVQKVANDPTLLKTMKKSLKQFFVGEHKKSTADICI